MKSIAHSPEEYISSVCDDKKQAIMQLRTVVQTNIPNGFIETIQYNMISYCVPQSIYPQGYHCDPRLDLPFISIAAQKHCITLYHMGIYADTALLDWFTKEYQIQCSSRLDMGKSCIRFKKMNDIPYALIAALVKKISPQDWIAMYETNLKK